VHKNRQVYAVFRFSAKKEDRSAPPTIFEERSASREENGVSKESMSVKSGISSISELTCARGPS